ncbi:hypothetical protein TNCV_49871 [Trichonephila clavipes]|nr:hypothetical protein TNCV_49871 [Trichonephila clavipes]
MVNIDILMEIWKNRVKKIDFVLKWLSRVGSEVGPIGDDRRVAIMDFGAPLTIGKAYLKIIMSSFLGFVNGILETGGVMDKCVQMWTRNYGALGQTARVCFGVLCANRKKEEVKRDFGDLRTRRSEGRVVNTPLVFKRFLFEETKETGKKKREREKEEKRAPEKRRADRWRKRRGESQSFAR